VSQSACFDVTSCARAACSSGPHSAPSPARFRQSRRRTGLLRLMLTRAFWWGGRCCVQTPPGHGANVKGPLGKELSPLHGPDGDNFSGAGDSETQYPCGFAAVVPVSPLSPCTKCRSRNSRRHGHPNRWPAACCALGPGIGQCRGQVGPCAGRKPPRHGRTTASRVVPSLCDAGAGPATAGPVPCRLHAAPGHPRPGRALRWAHP
jgi:hypothetical protein